MPGASVHKKGRRYYVVIASPGKRVWLKGVSYRTKREALDHAKIINAELVKGEYRAVTTITFAELSEIWLRDYAEPKLKRSTLKDYRSSIRRHLVPFFGTYDVADITPEMCQRFVTNALQTGTSPVRITKLLVPLKRMLKDAVLWGYSKSNPAESVVKPRYDPPEMQFLNPGEVRRLLDAADEYYRPLLMCAVHTGMRMGELFGLRWSDIDWVGRTIHVRYALYDGELIEPKTRNARRKIPMTHSLARALADHATRCPPSVMNLVFCQPTGAPIDESNFRNRVYYATLDRAGIRRIRFHDLRHTAVSLFIAAGADLMLVKSICGHSSVTVTERYSHLLPGVGHDAADRMEQLLDNAPSGDDVPECREEPDAWGETIDLDLAAAIAAA
jgi:integrase